MKLKEGFYQKHILPNITFALLLGIGGGGIKYYVDQQKNDIEVEQRIPDTPELMTKIKDHVNEVPSDVENYKREVQLIEQQSILIEQTSKLDSFYGFAQQKFTKDSIKELKVIKSRAMRDSTNKKIQQTLEIILNRLDTIN